MDSEDSGDDVESDEHSDGDSRTSISIDERLSHEDVIFLHDLYRRIKDINIDEGFIKHFLIIDENTINDIKKKHRYAFDIFERITVFVEKNELKDSDKQILSQIIYKLTLRIRDGLYSGNASIVTCYTISQFLFVFQIIDRRLNYHPLIEYLHYYSMKKIYSEFGSGRVARSLGKWRTPLINNIEDGMCEPAYMSLIESMLYKIAKRESTASDWNVMFYMKYVIHLDVDLNHVIIQDIITSYSKISVTVEKILMIFSVEYDDIGHVLSVLVSRSNDGNFITILDNVWNDNNNPDYQTYYLKLLTVIARAINMTPIRIALPSMIRTEKEDSSIVYLTLDFLPVWLKNALETKLDTESTHSHALKCPYEAYLYIKSAILEAPYSTGELKQNSLDVYCIIDNISIELSAYIIAGYAVYSKASIHAALLGSNYASPFYVIDAGNNKPSDVYALAVNNKQCVSVLQYKSGDCGGFTWAQQEYDISKGLNKPDSGVAHLDKRKRIDKPIPDKPIEVLNLMWLLSLFQDVVVDTRIPGPRAESKMLINILNVLGNIHL